MEFMFKVVLFYSNYLVIFVLLAATVRTHDNNSQSVGTTELNSINQHGPGVIQTNSSTASSSTIKPKPIYLLTLLPYPDTLLNPSWPEGLNIVPALNLAIERIRNTTNLLRNYDLRLIHAAEGCEFLSKTYENFIKNMFVDHRDKKIVGILGPACSLSTITIADLTARQELSLVTVHDSGTPLLSNATRYPFTLGVFGSTEGFVNAILSLMRKNEWHKIAVLYQDLRTYYRTTLQQFESALSQKTFNYSVKILFSSAVSETFYPLSDVRDSGARIILVLAAEEHLLRMMCIAHSTNMVLPFYQWVIPSEQLDTLFNDVLTTHGDSVTFYYDNKLYNCSANDIIYKALNGSILMNFRLTTLDKEKNTQVGFTFNEFNSLYKQRVEQYNSNCANENQTAYRNCAIEATYWAHNMYDAVWAWAYVLDELATVRELNLSAMKYDDNTTALMIMDGFFKLKFDGISGQISFNNGTRFDDRIVDLYQVLNGNSTHVAFVNSSSQSGLFPISDVNIVHIEDSLLETTNLVHPALIAFFSIVASVLLIAVIVLHTFTLVYRKFESVKASSIQLNQFIFFGVYTALLGLVLYLISEQFHVEPQGLCQTIWAWIIPISFTLAYGPLVARTWRVYRIFVHYLDPGPLIANKILIGFVIFLLSIDVVIATFWTVFDPLIRTEIPKNPDNDHTKLETTTRCWCDYYFAWQATVITYKTVVLFILLILAHLTGGITHQSFQTASLRVLGYLNFFLFLLCVPMYSIFNVLSHNPNAAFVIFCLMMVASITLLIGLIFFPPILPLFRKKTAWLTRRMSR